MRPHLLRFFAAVSIVAAMLVPAARANASLCLDQFGTTTYDEARAMATDGSNIWIGGITMGSINGLPYKGDNEAFVREYSSLCSVAWTAEFGTTAADNLRGAATDGSGNVYVVGQTWGKLPGQSFQGATDAFIRSYDANGNIRWTREFGTPGGEDLWGVAVDGNHLYVSGTTTGTLPGQKKAGHSDAFVRAYKTSGKLLWTRQFGTASFDYSEGVAVYQGKLFVAGETDGTFKNQTYLGNGDGYIREYSTTGVKGFTTEFGTSDNEAISGIIADASGEVIGGTTEGSFQGYTNQGVQDVFVKAFLTNGSADWIYENGTTTEDLLLGITAEGPSSIAFTGVSFGGLGEGSPSGNPDTYAGFIGRNGSSPVEFGFGSNDSDFGEAIIPYSGEVAIAGRTYGSLVSSNLGDSDAFFTPCCA